MDKIIIKNLEVYGHHGVLKEENILGQKFLVTVTLYTDVSLAGRTDNLEDSVSYSEVAHEINSFFQKNTCKLIEAVAEQLAENILMIFLVDRVTIQVKKPWAPILLPLETVSVEITRQWHRVYLGIGSNLGNKEENLNKAIELLKLNSKIRVMQVSDFILTKPYGGVQQDDFLNGALELKTLLSPRKLLEEIHQIEKELKRERVIHWGPRTIDLDILLYDQMVVRESDLIIPHIEMQKREFVLKPLAEIAPEVKHPLIGKNMYQLLEQLTGN